VKDDVGRAARGVNRDDVRDLRLVPSLIVADIIAMMPEAAEMTGTAESGGGES